MYFSEVMDCFILSKKFNQGIFIVLLFIQFKRILLDYYENNYEVANLSQQASIIDITDYYNLYLLITTEKKIYTGMPPQEMSVTTSNIINNVINKLIFIKIIEYIKYKK